MEKTEQDRIKDRDERIRENLLKLAGVYRKSQESITTSDKILALGVIRDLVADWV